MENDSNVINNFTIELSNTKKRGSSKGFDGVLDEIKGQRLVGKLDHFDRHYDNTYFCFRLLTNQETLKIFLENLEKDTATKYNIRFHDNRTTFLSQHLALHYMLRHNLVNCLINNELYDKDVPEKLLNIELHTFQYVTFNYFHIYISITTIKSFFYFFTECLAVNRLSL